MAEAPAETTVVNFMGVETPYCVLQYPAMWAEWLRTVHSEAEGVYTVDFYCQMEGHDPLLMFSVLLGGDEGEQLGVVTTAAGEMITVNILVHTPSEEGLDEDALNILYAMQEALNVLIDKLPLQ